jgi:hypothetical protein
MQPSYNTEYPKNALILSNEQIVILQFLSLQKNFVFPTLGEIIQGARLDGVGAKAIIIYQLLDDLIAKKLVDSNGEKILPVYRITIDGRNWLKENKFSD